MRVSRKIPREMMPQDGSPGPTRRIETRHPLRVIRLYPSTLMGCLVPCESAGEMAHWMTIDADGSVATARAQPEMVYWNDDGIRRRHVPDAEVRFDDGRTVVREVKPRTDLSARALAQLDHRTAILQVQLQSRGTGYEVVDSTCSVFLRRVQAAKDVLTARRHAISPGLAFLVREAIALRGAATFGCLLQLVPGVSRVDLMALVLRRKLVVALDQGPISAWTPVRIPHSIPEEFKR